MYHSSYVLNRLISGSVFRLFRNSFQPVRAVIYMTHFDKQKQYVDESAWVSVFGYLSPALSNDMFRFRDVARGGGKAPVPLPNFMFGQCGGIRFDHFCSLPHKSFLAYLVSVFELRASALLIASGQNPTALSVCFSSGSILV